MAAKLRMPNFNPFLGGNLQKREENYTPERAFPAAIKQSASDYDELMGRYRSALERPTDTSNIMQTYSQLASGPGRTYTPYSPTLQSYTPSGGYESLAELSRTGGYGESDISALRARGISPIRSIYANAMRNLNRTRAIQGGYSPSYNATTARMARELSEQIGGATTNVNAEIARMVAQGRLQAAPQYAQIMQQEAGRKSNIERGNVEAQRRAEEFNRQMQAQIESENFARQVEAARGMAGISQSERGREAELLGGMKSLYGTTPALAELFGRQAIQGEQLGMQAAAQRVRRSRVGGVTSPMARWS